MNTAPRRTWIACASACLSAAVLLLALSPLFAEKQHPVIHIRCQDAVGDAERTALERELTLRPAGQTAPTTWRYEITDDSAEHLRSIVQHARVADTDGIDRTTFRLAPDAGLGERRPGSFGAWAPGIAFALVDYGPIFGIICGAICGLFALQPVAAVATAQSVRAAARGTSRFLSRGVPEISARALGVFRIFLAVGLFHI